jgi:hypothetical protein
MGKVAMEAGGIITGNFQKKLVEFARRYYNCFSLEGMP